MSLQSSSARSSKSRSFANEPASATSEFYTSHLKLVQMDPCNKDSSALASFFNEICPLSEEAITSIHEGTRAVFFRKGEFLSTPAAKNNNLYFILKGVVRAYANQDGKDITLWINADHQMVGYIPILGILPRADQHLQAIEDSILVIIPQTLIEYFYEHFSEASLIGRALIEDYTRCTMAKDNFLRMKSADEKFEKFNATLPELSDRIPPEYVASYLDIKQETLSRLRAKMDDLENLEKPVQAQPTY